MQGVYDTVDHNPSPAHSTDSAEPSSTPASLKRYVIVIYIPLEVYYMLLYSCQPLHIRKLLYVYTVEPFYYLGTKILSFIEESLIEGWFCTQTVYLGSDCSAILHRKRLVFCQSGHCREVSLYMFSELQNNCLNSLYIHGKAKNGL